MHQSERRDGASSNGKGIKKVLFWPDYFAWMVKIAEGLVGKNDAEDVANAALYDYCCSDRPRPSMEQRQDVERLLRRLLWERARAFWKSRKTRKSEILFRFDPDEPHPEFDQAMHGDDIVDRLILMRALESLSEDERDLVLGYYWEECTAKELAYERKTNQNTVNARIRRSLPRMAAAMTEQHRRSRKENRRHAGGFFFLPWIDELKNEALRRMREIRENLASFDWTHLGRRIAVCMPLAVLPEPITPPENVRPHEEPEPRLDFSWPVERLAVAFDTLVSHQDRAIAERPLPGIGSVREAPQRVETTERADSSVTVSLPFDGHRAVAKEEEIEPLVLNECQNSLDLAMAKKNTNHFAECVEMLQWVRRKDPVCAQTEDWKLLNTACRNP